jgi:hypothetical protein
MLNWGITGTNAYPLIVGGAFMVREVSTANQTAVGLGGTTLSSGLYGGVGQYTATTAGGWMRGSLGSGDQPINGPTVAIGSIVAAVYISRAATDHTLFVNGVKYTSNANNSGLNDSWANFTINAARRATTAIFYGKQSTALGFYATNGADPGDRWLEEFSKNPWGAWFAPRRVFLPVGFTTGAATHTTTGALVADAAVVAGAALHPHTTTGALSAQAATVSGAAVHPHTTSGALVADAAVVAGSATLSPTPVTHTTTGALVAGEATVSGQAAAPSRGGNPYYDEPKKKRRFIQKIGNKLVVFNSANEAIRALESDKSAPAEEQAETVAPAKKADKAPIVPELSISIPEIKAVAENHGRAEEVSTLIRQRDYSEVIAIYEAIIRQQDEEDIELILLMH